MISDKSKHFANTKYLENSNSQSQVQNRTKKRIRNERLFRLIFNRVLSNVVFIGIVVIIFELLIIVIFWQYGNLHVANKNDSIYFLRELLIDSTETALKIGAVLAGIIGIYKYWYSRYEPLIYFVACGLIPISLAYDLVARNPSFRRLWGKKELPKEDSVADLQRLHDLPIIVLHRSTLELLGIGEGAKVDLIFQTPEDKAIWAIAFAFSFESTGKENYKDWPIGVSLSLRRYFRMERPCSIKCLRGKAPVGWKIVKMNTKDLANLHASTKLGNDVVWMASDKYSVRFRDPDYPFTFFDKDSFQGRGRILEYIGISLRVMKRSLVRYRAAYE